MEVQSILRKNAMNIPSRIHLTLVARIVVYSIKTDSAKTKGEDLILENKDTRHQGALPDPDTPVHHTLDNKPMKKIEHTKIHTKIKEKTDLALEALAEIEPAHKKNKEMNLEISHPQDTVIIPRQTKPVDTE